MQIYEKFILTSQLDANNDNYFFGASSLRRLHPEKFHLTEDADAHISIELRHWLTFKVSLRRDETKYLSISRDSYIVWPASSGG